MVQVRGAPPSRRTRIACHMPTGRVRPQFRRAARSDVRRWGKRSGQASRPRCGKKPGSGAWGERRRSPARGKSRRRGDVRRDVALVVGRRGRRGFEVRSARTAVPIRTPVPRSLFPALLPIEATFLRHVCAALHHPARAGGNPTPQGALGRSPRPRALTRRAPEKRPDTASAAVQSGASRRKHTRPASSGAAAHGLAPPRATGHAPRRPVPYGPGHPRPPARARPRPCTRRPIDSRPPERGRFRRSEDGPAGAGGTGRRSPSRSLASRPPDGCPARARQGSCQTAPGRDRQGYAAASKPVSRASFFSSNRACFSI